MPRENARKVNRLCRVRTISDVTLADFPLLPTDEHGFLDVAAILHSLEVGGFVNPVDVAKRAGAFVLLGEPGIGKSTSLAQSTVGTAFEIPGRALTEQTLLRLLEQLREKSDRNDLQRPQTILIDQLDESPIVQSIAEIIRLESDASTFQSVKVLVGCRTAEYPSELTALLVRLCGGCVVAELSPLTRGAAVELASSLTDASGESLIREVENLGAGALACIPLTLELLAAEYRDSGSVTGGITELFDRGIRRLLARTPDLGSAATDPQRLAFAKRAAAFLLLTGRHTLARNWDEVSERDLSIQDLVVGFERVDGGFFEVTKEVAFATLRSALIAGGEGNRAAFSHGSFASFLAAHYLADRRLPEMQLRQLLTVAAPDSVASIPPMLREMAAWFVALAPEQGAWLIHEDPEGLAAHSMLFGRPDLKAALVESLIRRAPEMELTRGGWKTARWNVAHAGLAAQLHPVLDAARALEPEDWDQLARVRLAIRLSTEAASPSLCEPLVTIAASGNWNDYHRSLAAESAFAIDEAVAADLCGIVRDLGNPATPQSPEAGLELMGTLLQLLYPAFISTPEVLEVVARLSPPDLIGAYRLFVHELANRIPERDLDQALAVIADVDVRTAHQRWEQQRDTQRGAYLEQTTLDEEVVLGVLDRVSLGNLTDDRLQITAHVLTRSMFGNEDPALPLGFLLPTEGARLALVRANRRRLAWMMTSSLVRDEVQVDRFHASMIIGGWKNHLESARRSLVPHDVSPDAPARLLDSGDLEWAYEATASAAAAGDESLSIGLARLAEGVFNESDPEQQAFVFERQSHPAWENISRFFAAEPIFGDEAEMRRKAWGRSKANHVDPGVVDDRLAALETDLGQAQLGDSEAFVRFTYNAQFDPSENRPRHGWERPIETLPGFRIVMNGEQRYVEAGKIYVHAESDKHEDWLDQGHFTAAALSGFKFLAHMARRGRLAEVASDDLEKWLTATLYFIAFEDSGNLLSTLALLDPSKTSTALKEVVSADLARGNFPLGLIERIPLDAEPLTEAAPDLLNIFVTQYRALSGARPETAKPENAPDSVLQLVQTLVSRWARQDRSAAESAVELLAESGGQDALWRRAVCGLFEAHPTSTWRDFALGPERGDVDPELAAALLQFSRARPAPWFLQDLNERELSTSYLRLAVWGDSYRRLGEEAPIFGPAADLERWRNECLYELANRGTWAAMNELNGLVATDREALHVRAAYSRARMQFRARGWRPPSTRDLFALLADPDRRVIRNEKELLQLVSETLEAVQRDLNGHGQLLWDVLPARKTSGDVVSPECWRPKNEAAVSEYLAHELKLRLADRGLAINREVLVKPTSAHGAGTRNDILIEAAERSHSLGEVLNKVALVIEVKGIWNRELMTAQRTQLAAYYLREGETRTGLYVVAQFAVGDWDDDQDQRRIIANRHDTDSLLSALEEQAVTIENELGRTTVPYILRIDRPRPRA